MGEGTGRYESEELQVRLLRVRSNGQPIHAEYMYG